MVDINIIFNFRSLRKRLVDWYMATTYSLTQNNFFFMIRSNRNTGTSNRSIESLNKSQPSRTYNATAFIDMDLQEVWQMWYENGIPYVINNANQTLIYIMASQKTPILSNFESPVSKGDKRRRYVISQKCLEILIDVWYDITDKVALPSCLR